MIDKLVGTAVENMGLFGLERLVDKLDARQAREAIATLEEVDARSTPASVFIVRDRQWSRKAEQLTDKLRVMWEYKTLFVTKLFDQQFTYKLQTTDRRRRKLLLNLASRVYELETGNRPQQATDLVPGILRALPKDPGTSTNLTLPASR